MKQPVLTLVALLGLLSATSPAATLIWNFGDDNATVDTIDGAATTTPPNYAASDWTLGNSLGTVADPVNSSSASNYVSASAGGNLGNAVKTGALATDTSSYYTLTLTPATGYAISLQDLDFGARSTGTGPLAFSIRTSLDNYTTDLFAGTMGNGGTWAFKDNTFDTLQGQLNVPLQIRIYTYNGTGNASANTQNNRLDDISVVASALAVPEPSTVLTLISGLSFLGLVRRRSLRTK